MNVFTCQGKSRSFTTPARATYSDSDVATAVSVCARQIQLIPPPIITATPETERLLSGRITGPALTHADSYACALSPRYVTPRSSTPLKCCSAFVTSFQYLGPGGLTPNLAIFCSTNDNMGRVMATIHIGASASSR